jgi:hypothetical protein
MPDPTPDPLAAALDPAAELGYLRACLGAAVVRPEAFDFAVLLPRIGRAVSALDAVLELAAGAVPGLCSPPADCTYACDSGDCDCSGRSRPLAWTLDPARVREVITAALTGKDSTDA